MLEDTVTAASSNEHLVRHGIQVMTPAAQAANGSGSFKFLGGGFSFDRPHVLHLATMNSGDFSICHQPSLKHFSFLISKADISYNSGKLICHCYPSKLSSSFGEQDRPVCHCEGALVSCV